MNNPVRNRSLQAAMAAVAGLMLVAPAMAEVKADGGWVRASAPGSKTTAAYLTLTNTGTEQRRLMKITSTVSDDVSVHRTSVTAQGNMRMWPMAVVAVEPGQTLKLEPGGIHVMINALKAPLVAGQKVPLTMKFDGGEAEFTLMLEVRPLVPMEMDMGMKMD
jgi:copper(I)-binding protein